MRFASVACALALLAAPALAQQRQDPADEQERLGGEAWYRQQLSDLAEVLGGAHYLRITCDGRDDQRWRNYMRGVIEREPQHNAILVDNFNRGYRQEEARFAVCDQYARQAEAELRARGLRISQGLRARHAE